MGLLPTAFCSRRLVPGLLTLVKALERYGELQRGAPPCALLLTLSRARADRLLQRAQSRSKPHGRTPTKPGTLLKQTIPVRPFAQWDDAQPSLMEIDLAVHCSASTRGEHLTSLDRIDVKTHF